jgi:hypothetical protein
VRPIGCVVLLAAAIAARAGAQQTELIARVQRTPASALDSTLPAVPLAQWLSGLRSNPAPMIRWEVNDCGEGGDGNAAPTCVEATLDLAPDTTAHLSVAVLGVDGRPAAAAVWDLYIMAGKAANSFKRLAEWSDRVRGHAIN